MNNVVSGSAGHVVQAASIRDVHFHADKRTPVPFQLPPAPRCFVSRQSELTALDGWPLVVLSGPGGVGKTSLALRWLHDRRADFPDGQLYVDLGAHSPSGPVDPDDVLEWFLHALGVPDVPVSLARRQALFRSATAQRAFSVLLDNAVSAGQVRPLLPASGTVVVTSRWRLSPLGVDGARFIEVDPLGVKDSVLLLESVVGARAAAEPVAARELARLCGGLPIALSVVGARLSARPRRTLAKEAGALRRDRTSVSNVLDLSYVDLPPREARLYRLCAWHPGTHFGVEGAAALVDEPVYEVEDALEDLVEKNLLIEVGDEEFRFHDVLREHARSQPDPERDTALRRVVEWYLDRAIEADLAAMPRRHRVGPRYRERTPARGLDWLERERTTLFAAVRLADEHGWSGLVWQLCEPLWALFLYGHNYPDWVDLHRRAIRAAQADGERLVEVRLRNRLALGYVHLHRHDEALAEVDAVLAAGLPDLLSRSTALSLRGGVHLDAGDAEAALVSFREVLEIRLEHGRDRGIGGARRRVGQALLAIGRVSEAMAELTEAEGLLSDRIERARARMFLADACLAAGQRAETERLLGSARDDLRDSPLYLADVFVRLAELAGSGEQARDHYRSALACYRDPTEPRAVRIRERLERYQDEPAPGVVPEQASSEAEREIH